MVTESEDRPSEEFDYFCGECDAQVQEDCEFCPSCGTGLSDTGEDEPEEELADLGEKLQRAVEGRTRAASSASGRGTGSLKKAVEAEKRLLGDTVRLLKHRRAVEGRTRAASSASGRDAGLSRSAGRAMGQAFAAEQRRLGRPVGATPVAAGRDSLKQQLPSKALQVFNEVVSDDERIEGFIVAKQDRQALVAFPDKLLFLRWTLPGALKALYAVASPLLVAGAIIGTHKNGTGHLVLDYADVDRLLIHRFSTGAIVEARTPLMDPVQPVVSRWNLTGRPKHWNALFVSSKELKGREAVISHIQSLVATASNDASTDNSRTTTEVPSAEPRFSVADELGKLADLRDRGVLSEEEFQEQKMMLLE